MKVIYCHPVHEKYARKKMKELDAEDVQVSDFCPRGHLYVLDDEFFPDLVWGTS